MEKLEMWYRFIPISNNEFTKCLCIKVIKICKYYEFIKENIGDVDGSYGLFVSYENA